ncbi:MAG: prepilin-type N-terminal cleavage/methylation domain-containing protein [Defluviicoccus sp.]|nr:MAG: prepilin-type N-terminal cleavage/methylation domain-containing protein [Defluviicoccus sp.]
MMRGQLSQRSASAGFTLVELLVSLTVLGFIASLAAGALHLGSRVWERTSSTAEALDEAFGAQDFLRELLAEAYPEPRGELGHVTADFSGTRNSIDFRAPARLSHISHGYIPLRLFLEETASDRRLVLSITEGGSDRQVVLLSGIRDASFSFFGTDDSGSSTGTWREDWTDQQHLPDLIQVAVVFLRPIHARGRI